MLEERTPLAPMGRGREGKKRKGRGREGGGERNIRSLQVHSKKGVIVKKARRIA